uniref:DNA ligase D 3'-phosphoesterase domain-containing protein n=1 Tax=Schlesneria paludicola TaxID=360056 RepID=A0A7C4LM24_9PLAN
MRRALGYDAHMRFAILTHDHPLLHWDLLLECGGICRTWRLLAPPDTLAALRAETFPDHRVFYLDYEGPVTGGRGRVSRWDGGRLVWTTARHDFIRVLCQGHRWNGVLTLRQIQGHWWATFAPRQSPIR